MREKSSTISEQPTQRKTHRNTMRAITQKLSEISLIISCLSGPVIPSTLLEYSHTVSTSRYTFSATSIGETVIHSFRNNLFSSNVFNAPYTEISKQLPSSFQYSVHLDTIRPYIICADILGTVYILDPSDELNILKTIKINAAGRARFFRSHIYGFDNTNYFFLINRNLQGTGSFFHDWSLLDSEVKQLTMDSHIIRLGSFERVSMIITVEEFEGKKVMKTDPTAGVGVIASFTHTDPIDTMIFLNETAGLSASKHLLTITDDVTAKIAVYDSTNDAFSNQKIDVLFNLTIDMLVIGETDYVGLCIIDPLRFLLVKIPTMEISVLDYGGDSNDPNGVKYLRQFAYIEDSEFIWLGIDNQFDMYKVLPEVCHRSCETCTKGVLISGCDTCPAGHSKRGGVCISSSKDCVTALSPYYFPETETCGEACENGFFSESAEICRSCVPNCRVCSDKLTCDTCATGFEKDSNDLCTRRCDLDEYFDGSTCQSCHGSCKSCDGPGDTDCTLCYELVDIEADGSCSNPCPFGQYFNENLATCQSCPYPCGGCEMNNGIKCLTCNSNLYKTPVEGEIRYVTCSSSCGDGFYPEGSRDEGTLMCSSCPTGCDECENSIDFEGNSNLECSVCSETFYYHNKSCITSCPPRTFHNRGFSYLLCSNCLENCDECSSVNFCDTCSPGYSLESDDTFCKSDEITGDNGNNGDNTRGRNGNNNDDDNGDSSFIISFFIVLIISIVFMILISKRKATQDRRERERRRQLRDTPLAEPFHPIIPQGQRNPLEPVDINTSEIDPTSIQTTIPLTNQNCVFGRQETFLEIDVMKDSERGHKPVQGGNINLKNLDGPQFAFAPIRNGHIGKIVPVTNTNYIQPRSNNLFNFNENFVSNNNAMTPTPYLPPNIGLPGATGPRPVRNNASRNSKIITRNKRMFVSKKNFYKKGEKNID